MDRFQYIAESDPNIAFSKTLKQEPFFSSLLLCILRGDAAGQALLSYVESDA